MPLYTYVLAYKGATHVAQGSHSNFKGFVSSWADLPAGALPGVTTDLRRELIDKAYRGEFVPVANLKRTWRMSLDVGGSTFVVVAIQTQP